MKKTADFAATAEEEEEVVVVVVPIKVELIKERFD